MNNYNNDKYCFCKECECDYDFTNNNQYGYNNCCLPCGENKYEEYLEEQEEKRKEINFNDLPCDIMTKIININKNKEIEEREANKNIFNDSMCKLHEEGIKRLLMKPSIFDKISFFPWEVAGTSMNANLSVLP